MLRTALLSLLLVAAPSAALGGGGNGGWINIPLQELAATLKEAGAVPGTVTPFEGDYWFVTEAGRVGLTIQTSVGIAYATYTPPSESSTATTISMTFEGRNGQFVTTKVTLGPKPTMGERRRAATELQIQTDANIDVFGFVRWVR